MSFIQLLTEKSAADYATWTFADVRDVYLQVLPGISFTNAVVRLINPHGKPIEDLILEFFIPEDVIKQHNTQINYGKRDLEAFFFPDVSNFAKREDEQSTTTTSTTGSQESEKLSYPFCNTNNDCRGSQRCLEVVWPEDNTEMPKRCMY